MITSDLLSVNLPGGTAQAVPGLGEEPLQMLDIKGQKFGDTLFSQLQLLTGTELESAEAALTGHGLLPADGNILPELPPGLLPLNGGKVPMMVMAHEHGPGETAEDGLPVSGLLLSAPAFADRLALNEQAARSARSRPGEAVTRDSALLTEDVPVQVNEPRLAVPAVTTLQSLEPLNMPGKAAEKTADNVAIINTASAARSMTADAGRQDAVTPKLDIPTPVQQQGWSESFTGRISWMIMNNQHSAQINLNPAELGPIEVKIHMQNDQASVNFTAHNGSAREAIQEAFPRLREMLVEHGLSLGQSSVSDQSFSGHTGQGELDNPAQGMYAGGGEITSADELSTPVQVTGTGLIDQFV